MHRQGHPHLYLLVLAGLIAIVLLLLQGDSTALSALPPDRGPSVNGRLPRRTYAGRSAGQVPITWRRIANSPM